MMIKVGVTNEYTVKGSHAYDVDAATDPKKKKVAPKKTKKKKK